MSQLKKCPNCKSNKGFKLEYTILGNGFEARDFNGNVLDAERDVTDHSHRAYCLSCHKPIYVELLNTGI